MQKELLKVALIGVGSVGKKCQNDNAESSI